MLRRFALSLLVLLAVGARSAHAYTPESGTWWNPNEPGTGLLIEIQDNFIAVFAYVYDSAGNATWYTSAGPLTGNARYDGFLDAFRGGQCIGCAWRPNTGFPGSGGPISIVFNPNDPTRATLTWGGRSVSIERFHFYLKRPADGNRPLVLTKMLGEWQLVLDFSELNGSFPFYGEILAFDLIDLSQSPGYVEGCRVDNSIDGYCSDAALRDHAAAGYFDARTGKHVIVVDDSLQNYAVYVLRVDTNYAEGEVSVYRKGTNPVNYYPTRGFRTASRKFVQDGVGPSKAATASAPRPGVAELLAAQGVAPDKSAVEPSLPRERLNAIVAELESRLGR